MRRWPILFMLTFLVAACGPPHPTHPTKVDCPLSVTTRFRARVDTSSPGTIKPGENPCFSGRGLVEDRQWTQRGTVNVSICVAAGTTPEQAAMLCSRHLESTGRRTDTVAPPLTANPPGGGRICGAPEVVESLITGMGGIPPLFPNECRQSTTLPLVSP